MLRACAALAVLLIGAGMQATAGEVQSLKPLLIEAIRSGRAEGTLGGLARAYTADKFGATTPIVISVTRVAAHEIPGCARLRVVTRQAAVAERDAKGNQRAPADQQLAYQVNFCENGLFPEEGGGR